MLPTQPPTELFTSAPAGFWTVEAVILTRSEPRRRVSYAMGPYERRAIELGPAILAAENALHAQMGFWATRGVVWISWTPSGEREFSTFRVIAINPIFVNIFTPRLVHMLARIVLSTIGFHQTTF